MPRPYLDERARAQRVEWKRLFNLILRENHFNNTQVTDKCNAILKALGEKIRVEQQMVAHWRAPGKNSSDTPRVPPTALLANVTVRALKDLGAWNRRPHDARKEQQELLSLYESIVDVDLARVPEPRKEFSAELLRIVASATKEVSTSELEFLAGIEYLLGATPSLELVRLLLQERRER